jgi:hypothetical protein
MRSRSDRIQDRASFLTPPFEEPAVMLAHAILELCHTVDDASERLTDAIDELRKDIGTQLYQFAKQHERERP